MSIKSNIIASLFTLLLTQGLQAQYAPQYPSAGHEAISYTDSRIIDWATQCTVTRGYMDIHDTELGLVSAGTEENALGVADGLTISLGDGGTAILEFATPITNGPGPDFVVFENGFAKPTDIKLAFLELAHVEVSNDGVNYYRFPSFFNVISDTQHTNDTYLDAQYIHNLAGKYVKNQGTPFDLDDVAHFEELDVNNIRFIKLIDVVGIIDDETYTSYDSEGRVINDPYPTPFPTGGFDLDAVGVLHNATTHIDETSITQKVNIYPNPTSDYLYIDIELTDKNEENTWEIFNINGQLMHSFNLSNATHSTIVIDCKDWHSGNYFLIHKNFVKTFIKK